MLLSVLAALLLLSAAWGYRDMTSRRASAVRAEDDLAECRALAGQIRQVRDQPALAGERERGSSETNALIEKAAKAAGITDANSIGRITPGSPRPVANAPYKEQATEVLLKRVTLRQLVTFLHGVLGSGAGLRAKSIHLSVPPGGKEELGDRWTAEVVLSYFIYDPLSAQR